jgi:hypothetical protein
MLFNIVQKSISYQAFNPHPNLNINELIFLYKMGHVIKITFVIGFALKSTVDQNHSNKVVSCQIGETISKKNIFSLLQKVSHLIDES